MPFNIIFSPNDPRYSTVDNQREKAFEKTVMCDAIIQELQELSIIQELQELSIIQIQII